MEKEKTIITIDGGFNVFDAAFYVLGLIQLFGKDNVRFGDLKIKDNKSVFCFSVCRGTEITKYAISMSDSYKIHPDLYEWCDVYGNPNANFERTPKEFHGKMVSLCPSFGVHLWNLPQTIYYALSNVRYSNGNNRKFFGKYKKQWKRIAYSDYLRLSQKESDGSYIFFLSTLWYNDEWNKNDAGVNARRACFVRACKKMKGITFEGGLVSQGKDRSSEELFSDCLSDGVPMKEWMEKTKRSVLVFNTPAFWDCHGWKLGEYLAMGKCIVSTALSNDLPVPLEHGKNIHFVENSEEAMQEAVKYIVDHPDYRAMLEKGAREYWEKYGSPVASLRLLGIER